jgi:hypothetical protein
VINITSEKQELGNSSFTLAEDRPELSGGGKGETLSSRFRASVNLCIRDLITAMIIQMRIIEPETPIRIYMSKF